MCNSMFYSPVILYSIVKLNLVFGNSFVFSYRTGELKTESEVETVAIKVLKESATREAEEDFMREVEIMSAFKHGNILSLIGVTLKGKSSLDY